MLSKGFRILWVKIIVDNHRHTHLRFPIPLYVFQELLDCLLDLLVFTSIFAPKIPRTYNSPSFSIRAIKELMQMLLRLFDSLAESEPYDLVEVTNDKVRISIKIR